MGFKRLLLKMQCCIVCMTALVTGTLLWFTGNLMHAGISGTFMVLYGIGLLLLVGIMGYDRIVNRDACEAGVTVSPRR